MLEDYQNKVCVVTGAASGIGKALCEKLGGTGRTGIRTGSQ